MNRPLAAMRGPDRMPHVAAAAEERVASLDQALEEARDLARRRAATIEQEMEAICEAAGFTLGQLRGPSRTAQLIELRRIVARFLDRKGHLSSTQIGVLMHRDHSSVLNLLGRRASQRLP